MTMMRFARKMRVSASLVFVFAVNVTTLNLAFAASDGLYRMLPYFVPVTWFMAGIVVAFGILATDNVAVRGSQGPAAARAAGSREESRPTLTSRVAGESHAGSAVDVSVGGAVPGRSSRVQAPGPGHAGGAAHPAW